MPDIALTNSGSIRVDDEMNGVLTQYDIIRILPYSGEVWEVEMKGGLLKRILEAGEENKDEGAYIQRKNVEFDSPSRTFRINGQLVNSEVTYMVALNDFMLAGYDFKWLSEETEGIIKIHKSERSDDARSDIRKAMIRFLQ